MEKDESRRHETMSVAYGDKTIARKIEHKIAQHGVDGYIDKLNHLHKDALSAAAVHDLADYVIPIDSILGPDESHPGNVKFMIGGLIGIDIARRRLGKFIDRELGKKLVTIFQDIADRTDGRDELDTYHNITEALLTAGHDSWHDHQAYHHLTEAVEEYICPEISYQAYLEAGMGMVMLAMTTIEQDREAERYQKDLQQLADSLPGIHDVDWDNLPWDS